jgi:hypothetical protein
MFAAVIIAALIVMAGVAGVFVVIVVGIRREDALGSITARPPGAITQGTRRVVGLFVDHTACQYVSNPQHTCPACRRAYTTP